VTFGIAQMCTTTVCIEFLTEFSSPLTCRHNISAEEVLVCWFLSTRRRADNFLATKFGAWDPEAKLTPPHTAVSKLSCIKYAFERSLKNLKTDYADFYYQHLVYPNVPIEVVLEASRRGRSSGSD